MFIKYTIDRSGRKSWHQNGSFHRLYGPAIEWADGTNFWYINGQACSLVHYNSLMAIKINYNTLTLK
jgi:hypothetical protein